MEKGKELLHTAADLLWEAAGILLEDKLEGVRTETEKQTEMLKEFRSRETELLDRLRSRENELKEQEQKISELNEKIKEYNRELLSLALHEKASLLFFLPSFSGLIHRDHFPHENGTDHRY